MLRHGGSIVPGMPGFGWGCGGWGGGLCGGLWHANVDRLRAGRSIFAVPGVVLGLVVAGAEACVDFFADGADWEFLWVAVGDPHFAAEGFDWFAGECGFEDFVFRDVVGETLVVAGLGFLELLVTFEDGGATLVWHGVVGVRWVTISHVVTVNGVGRRWLVIVQRVK